MLFRSVPSGQPIWYLPHHAVTSPQKPEKIRVVFDCAARYRNSSLNQQILQGPDQTNTLLGTLMRFRQGPVAMASDVEAMFHQVFVDPRDIDVLRFLWWENGDLTREPREYQMLVHLFGATSSPSCCSFALRKTAEDQREAYHEETVKTVYRNFYVDDMLKSSKTEAEAVQLCTEIRELLANGGFRLTKWVSNNKNVLAAIPDSERAESVKDLDLDNSPIERALGVQWNVHGDVFQFRAVRKDKPPTRRGEEVAPKR